MERVNSGFGSDQLLARLKADPMFGALSDESLASIANTVIQERQQQVSSTLSEVALFQGLGEDDLAEIGKISESLMVGDGEVLFEEGEEGDCFYVIMRGTIELSKKGAEGPQKLAVLRNGQAFGEMSLLNEAPRSATATAQEQTYMVAISKDAFQALLGEDNLAVRMMKNLSKALWATSVRLTAKQAQVVDQRAALAEFNRVLGSRLEPKDLPSVAGYDVASVTARHAKAVEGSAWDWFQLRDGRAAFAIMSAQGDGSVPALDVALVRALVREIGTGMQLGLADLVFRTNDAYRGSLIDGISGKVSLTLVAIDDASVEWVACGSPFGVIVRAGGDPLIMESLNDALGSSVDFFSTGQATLHHADRIAMVSGGDLALRSAGSTLPSLEGQPSDQLGPLVDAVRSGDSTAVFDVVATLMVRSGAAQVREEDSQGEAEAPAQESAAELVAQDASTDGLAAAPAAAVVDGLAAPPEAKPVDGLAAAPEAEPADAPAAAPTAEKPVDGLAAAVGEIEADIQPVNGAATAEAAEETVQLESLEYEVVDGLAAAAEEIKADAAAAEEEGSDDLDFPPMGASPVH